MRLLIADTNESQNRFGTECKIAEENEKAYPGTFKKVVE